ncbi:tellurite resistance TerB C-terminal domain-containing protein, partial [Chlorogloea sp. CCALA 695]|uniref:tellurite resistance TerB C-terminal domain-containing protein n=1 Tax=Chlorogloea sp. CCALA 695 TaxID=2107693 RepID=UPI000D07CE5F
LLLLVMVNNRLLLGSVVFSASLVLSLIVSQDVGMALKTGVITIPATFLGIAAVNLKQRNQQKLILNDLQAEIYQLEKWQSQLNQSLRVIAEQRQQTETNINFLQVQLRQLSERTTEQRYYQQQVTQELDLLVQQKHSLETTLQELQAQVQGLEQHKGEIDQSVRSLKKLKHDTEAEFYSFENQLQDLRSQVTHLHIQKQELEDGVTLLNRLKPQLEEKSHQLQSKIQQLEKQQAECSESLDAIAKQKDTTQIHLSLLNQELLEQHDKNDKIKQEVNQLIEQRKYLISEKPADKIPEEWQNFISNISQSEKQVIEAIMQQEDPSAVIKRIAEDNITMPELLIDSINECALDTIGDLLIEPRSDSIPLGIMEEYLILLNKILNLNKTL